MGRARELWEAYCAAIERRDADALVDLFTPDAVWLEPQNPPHETNLLIQAYLKDWLEARENLDVTTKRLLESSDGLTLAAEWSVSYSAAGRRWNDLPRASWVEVDEVADAIRFQRDYW
ncbi:MAG TPA: nuclear transport factor 2 family protein [Egibacteraceae bacterium]|nr:nuclear transport factor 2 family protein [Egibacteraceae bacterium]